MSCCKCECAYVSIIVGIIAGVILGILFALGFVSTGIIFWAYLLVGVLGVLLAPIYGFLSRVSGAERCFCGNRILYLVGAVGTVILSAISLIITAFAGTTLIAVAIALATFFVTVLIVTSICITNCVCNN